MTAPIAGAAPVSADGRSVSGQGFRWWPGATPRHRETVRVALRIAAFDKVAVSGIKQLVDAASLPEDSELAPGLAAFFATSGRPENAPFARTLLEHGLQQPEGVEVDLGTAIGRLRQQDKA